jgi:uncharacterized lipoprotein YmbA
MRPARIRDVVVVAVVLVAAGCAVTDSTRYYALTAARPPAPVAPAGSRSPLTVGVGPVTIPGYLDRPQIVTRDADDGLQVWPYHRWAERLDLGIAQALAEDLGARIPSDRVAVFPWRGVVARAIDYQVVVSVVRLDGIPGRSVTMDARWALLGKGNQELAFKRFTVTQPVTDGFPALVAGMTRAIGALGDEVSQEIQSQSGSRAATRN